MSVGPLVTEIVLAFCLATTLLYRYGNIFRNHIVVTVSVLIAWYFSLLIIFVLPLDVSSTVYRQCVEKNSRYNLSITTDNNNTSNVTIKCEKPWSSVPDSVFPNLWRIVYWTSQCLTWLILPLMQSYIKAGDFTVKGKLKSALIDNAIYYGSYLFICGVLLIYIALKPGLDLDGQKLKAIASSASNTWGLFLLIMLLGYALVEVPRGLWNASKPGFTLQYSYFKASKLNLEKCEAEETVDDILESLQAASTAIGSTHPFHRNLETIFQKVPIELKERMNRRQLPEDAHTNAPSEKSLIRLHRQTIKALQTLQRTETQWGILVEQIFHLEDISKNQTNHDRRFKSSFPTIRPFFIRLIYNPTLVLKIRLLNLYYLAPHHQTNEYSLIFSGMMFCRLTPPMCLNFLGLIHMDSHIIKTHILETHYTQVMGHMDVISIISDGFNVYFPMAILAFCLATYFSLGSRLLSVLGFQQFLGDDEVTTDLVDEGRELIQRERRRRQRIEESIMRRREFQERTNNPARNRNSRQSVDTVRSVKRDESTESVRAGLLRDFDTSDYYVGTTFNSSSNRYGANNAYERNGYQSSDFYDINNDEDNSRIYSSSSINNSSSNYSRAPPRRIFDDV
ncbi:Similar to GA20843: LMBR1 domain-containing protein 2 homolog (Drosophila pseudoobscura pseudoobscura) [Cotesia congregata]|uniref:Similar to GA20843: LMBR1 domain-containing protein 2 homolog (Drosophila pseudoobscura pseudoobscura) n=1 Tax=Cotesia congregata TaxID=51543 RepID=A0A8J2HM46_COTCN|nr:Similar to GA20843: LMBR1 domain-containing protein 2 homolog (Drosophila pseudoobscura pseudoobscura) [Cotesia congregata]